MSVEAKSMDIISFLDIILGLEMKRFPIILPSEFPHACRDPPSFPLIYAECG